MKKSEQKISLIKVGGDVKTQFFLNKDLDSIIALNIFKRKNLRLSGIP